MEKPAGADPDIRHQRAGAEPDILGRHQWRGRRHPVAGGCDLLDRGDTKTKPFAAAFKARFGTDPAYTGYTAYDDVYILADAIKRAGSTDPDKMVAELEKTDYVGTIGRLQFYGRDDQFTHGLKYGPDNVSGMVFQWQDGKQVTVWPARIAEGKLKYPAFARPTN